jgi:multidrug efflux pump subunit AcrA (membrane-fusion protein)
MRTVAILRALITLLALCGAAFLGWKIYGALLARNTSGAAASSERVLAPVAVAMIEQGPITLRRTFSGSIEASESFVVAARVGGRLIQMDANI